MKIAVCSIGNPALHVFKASLDVYAKEHELVLSGPGGLPNAGRNFGESYNSLLLKIFETETECIVANDDVVLRPDTMKLILEDVRSLQASGVKLGWVGAQTDRTGTQQNISNVKPGDKFPKATTMIAPFFTWVSREAFMAAPFAPTHYGSDDVSCYDMVSLGYKLFISRAYVHHVHQASGAPPRQPDHRTVMYRWAWENRPAFAAARKWPKPETH